MARLCSPHFDFGLESAIASHALALTPTPLPQEGEGLKGEAESRLYSTTTGIFPIRACHSFGPVLCTDSPVESTATVTGMSCTSNS